MIHRPSDVAIAATLVAELKADQATLLKVCTGSRFFDDREFAKKVVTKCIFELYEVDLEKKGGTYGNPTLACIQTALNKADIELMGRVSNCTGKKRDKDAFRVDARLMQTLFNRIIRCDKDKTRYKNKNTFPISKVSSQLSSVQDVRRASALAGASSSDCPEALGATESALRAQQQHGIEIAAGNDDDDDDDDDDDEDDDDDDDDVLFPTTPWPQGE